MSILDIFLEKRNYMVSVAQDINNLKEQRQNLKSCLERLRNSRDKFPSMKEALWMESMMESSLLALESHIRDLEKLAPREQMPNTLYKR